MLFRGHNSIVTVESGAGYGAATQILRWSLAAMSGERLWWVKERVLTRTRFRMRNAKHPVWGVGRIIIVAAFLAQPVVASVCENWVPGQGLRGLSSGALAAAAFDDGVTPTVYVGGTFSVAGNVVANKVARWNPATQTWSALGLGLNNTVYALAVLDGKLFAGGDFTTAGHTNANRIACWDPSTQTWLALGTGLNGRVRALAPLNGKLYVGGSFSRAGGMTADGVACWDPATQTWAPLGSGIDGSVFALTVLNGKLYVGGAFSTAGGAIVNCVACWDPAAQTWSSLGPGVNPSGWVNALTVLDGRICVGGLFYVSEAGVGAYCVSCWDPLTQAWSALGSGVNDEVWALTVLDGKLYAGGFFTTADGATANRVACWDPATQTWAPLGSGIDGSVFALTVLNGKLYVGGAFSTAGGAIVNRVASWDPSAQAWSALGTGINNYIYAITALNGMLYAGGDFTTAGDAVASHVGCWNPSTQTWSALGSGVNNRVQALTVLNGRLYLGGAFTTAGGATANRVACWDPATQAWSVLGSGINDYSVYALTALNGKLYAGGSFATAGGAAASRVACWDPATQAWSPLGSGVSSGNLYALTVLNGKLYAGGDFITAGGAAANRVACWDPSTQAWFALGSGLNGTVQTLAVLNGKLHAGGSFTTAGGATADRVACWDPAAQAWSVLGSGMNDTVYALTALNGKLYAGGSFTTAGGATANRVACWDPFSQAWSALGMGLNDRVLALVAENGNLYAGGRFLCGGETVSAYWAQWIPASGQVVLTANTVIAPGDTTYECKELTVNGCTLTVDGSHTLATLTVTNNGVVTHSAGTAGCNLAVSRDLIIHPGSAIHADGKGYGSETGPGAGTGSSGGGHGGEGAGGGGVYGSIAQPTELGSGGAGCGPGSTVGAGGGAIRLTVGGTLLVDGRVSADGANGDGGTCYAGGGAGGSLWISANTLVGNGTISANGGGSSGYGGGGGRLALDTTYDTFSGIVTARGGGNIMTGGAGTIFRKLPTEANGLLSVDNWGANGATTPLPSGSHTFDSVEAIYGAQFEIPPSVVLNVTSAIAVSTYATITLEGDGDLHSAAAEILPDGRLYLNRSAALSGLHIHSGGLLSQSGAATGLDLTVSENATIDEQGVMQVDGRGYTAGNGPGAGQANFVCHCGGGGGHGGKGGAGGAAGGAAYGSVAEPVEPGSGGGGCTPGSTPGAGGGTIRLTVDGTLTVNGWVSADGFSGSDATCNGGGGAGGSIYVSAGTLTGEGIISARGGSGSTVPTTAGGGGGGGRIAIHTSLASGKIVQNLFALGGRGYTNGEPGTVYPFASRPENNPAVAGGEPVYTHSGEFATTVPLIDIPARGQPIRVVATYRSHSSQMKGFLGYGWESNLGVRLRIVPTGDVLLRTDDNSTQLYALGGSGYVTPAGRYDTLVKNPNNTYTLTDKHQTRHEFNTYGDLTAIVDRNGNTLTFTRPSAEAPPTRLTDATGRQVNFTYNAKGLLAGITDFAGRTWTLAYDPAADDLLAVTEPATPEFPAGTTTHYAYENHRIVSITDAKGQVHLTNQYDSLGRVMQQGHGENVYTFTYDAQAMQTVVTDGRGIQRRTTHNTAGNAAIEEVFTQGIRPGDPASYTTTSSYNGSAELIETVAPRGNREKFMYDGKGNLLTRARIAAPVSGQPNAVTSYSYNPTYSRVQTLTDPRSTVTTGTHDPTNGDLLTLTRPTVAGQTPVTTFTYNSFGQILIRTEPDGRITRYDYDATTGYLINQTYNYGGTPQQVTEYAYDAVGNRTSVKDPNGHTTTFAYNAQNQLTQETSPLGYVTRYRYDANGNRIKVERQNPAAADGWQTTTYAYTVLNKVATKTDDVGHVTSYTYDANENVIAVEDAEHHITTSVYDERNLLYKTIDAQNHVIDRGYDANGNLNSFKDPNGNTTTFAYDGFERLATTTYPDGTTEVRTYDAAGNLTQVKNRRNQNIGYTYDALNRRSTRSRPDYSTVTYIYDLVGRPLTMTDSTGTITNEYDTLGRLRQVTDAAGRSLAYEYDLAGNRTRLTYPDGSWLTYEYDAMNRLTVMREQFPILPGDFDRDRDVDADDLAAFEGCATGPGVPRTDVPACDKADLDSDNDVDQNDFGIWQCSYSGSSPRPPAVVTYQYDALSRRVQADPANGTRATFTQDDADRMTSCVHQLHAESLTFGYTHDAVGNRLTQTLNGATTAYTYDAIYQVTAVDYPAIQDTVFNYDATGNRTSMLGAFTTTYTPNNLNQYTNVGGTAFGYDGSGNLTSDGVNTYGYDPENRLVSATTPSHTAAYTYDARDLRVAATVDGTTARFLYDGSKLVAEYNGSGQLVRRYIHELGQGAPVRMDVFDLPGGSTFNPYYYHEDSLGSVIALSNSTGGLAERYEYDAYGQVANPGTVGNPWLFTGQHRDSETGLYHYRARAYSPELGRFTQTDPMAYDDGPNLYTYVLNNPVNAVDPTGMWGVTSPAGVFVHDEGGKLRRLGQPKMRSKVNKHQPIPVPDRPVYYSNTAKVYLALRGLHHGALLAQDLLLPGEKTQLYYDLTTKANAAEDAYLDTWINPFAGLVCMPSSVDGSPSNYRGLPEKIRRRDLPQCGYSPDSFDDMVGSGSAGGGIILGSGSSGGYGGSGLITGSVPDPWF